MRAHIRLLPPPPPPQQEQPQQQPQYRARDAENAAPRLRQPPNFQMGQAHPQEKGRRQPKTRASAKAQQGSGRGGPAGLAARKPLNTQAPVPSQASSGGGVAAAAAAAAPVSTVGGAARSTSTVAPSAVTGATTAVASHAMLPPPPPISTAAPSTGNTKGGAGVVGEKRRCDDQDQIERQRNHEVRAGGAVAEWL